MKARTVVSASLSCLLVFQTACERQALECESGYCGTAIIVTGGPVRTLFPPLISDITDQALADLIFQPLADIGFELNTIDPSTFIPRLASSWEFEDPLTLVFRMNPDAKWHDGAPVTAHDVAFTYSVYADPRVEGPVAGHLSSIETVTARDDRTAVFRFNRQHREQFYAATYHMRILPRHILGSVPRDSLAGHSFAERPVGNGPYRFVRLNEGVSIEIEADTNFYLGRPGIPKMIWQFGSDPNTRMTLLVSEEADILSIIPGPENVSLAQRQEHLNVFSYAGNFYGYMAFNLLDPEDMSRPHPLFGDSTVRRAIALAVDRDLVAKTVFGDSADAPTNPTTPMVRVHEEEGFELPYDPDEARRLLDEANYRDTNGDGTRDRNGREMRFRLSFPTTSQLRITSAGVIASLLDQIGIDVELEGAEYGVFRNGMEEGNFDAYLGSWYLQPSPAGIPGLWGSGGIGNQNFGGYGNARVDSLLELAMSETNAEMEQRYWREAFAEMNRDPGALWLYQPINYAAIHNRFENVTIRPDRWAATMWQWRVRDGEWLERDIDPLR